MPEICPDSQAEITKSDRFIVLDEKGLAGCGLGGDKVLRCQDMGVCNVGHISDIPQVESIPDHKRGLSFGDAGVDRREELRVSRTTEHRGSKGTSCHCAAVCFENQFFRSSLIQNPR